MDLLRDWLAPAILDELAEALQWKEGETDRRETVGHSGETSYKDDGSNLRVASSKKGVVQVCKFLSFEEPILATITDGFTRINAKIAVAASREYQRQKKKPLTEGKVGGLIQIQDFEIVATHLGPRTNRLTLLVKEFKSLGADGSVGFGMPRPIETIDREKSSLLKKLEDLRDQEKIPRNQVPPTRQSSVPPSSILFQAGAIFMSDAAPNESQAGFATQVPIAREAQKSHIPDRHTNGASDKHLSESKKLPALPSAHAEGTKPPESLITQTANSESHPKPASASYLSLLKSTFLHKTKPPTDPAESIEQDFKQKEQPADSIVDTSTVQAPTRKEISDFVETGAGQQTTEAPSSASLVEVTAVTEISEGPLPAEPAVFDASVSCTELQQRSSKKRKLNDKISSRDIYIPNDQQALLARSDSWLPAEPDGRKPVANIPIAILETLNHDADRRAKDLMKSRSRPLDEMSDAQIEVLHDTQESEAESAIPSEEWPLSPDRNQLPPDSSPPAPDELGRQIEAPEADKSPMLDAPFTSPQSKGIADKSLREKTGHRNSKEAAPDDAAAQVPSIPVNIEHPIPNERHLGANSVQNDSQLQDVITSGNSSHLPREEPGPRTTEEDPSMIDNETYHSTFSRTDSSVPDDSDIEMTVPVPLQETTESQINIAPQVMVSSTASPSKQPFTQVKRTPYVSSRARELPKRHLGNHRGPSLDKDDDLRKGTFAQVPPTASSFISKPDAYSVVSHGMADNVEAQEEIMSQQPFISEDLNPKIPILQKCALPCETADKSSPGKCTGKGMANEVSTVESSPAKRPRQIDEESTDSGHGSRRKKYKPSFFHPNSNSRREKPPIPPALDLGCVPDNLPDPAVSARKYRQDWFAARRSSESSAARDSPISPLKGHAFSVSNLATSGSRRSSGLATPVNADNGKTAEEVNPINSASTRAMAERISESLVASAFQRDPQAGEQPTEMDVDPPLTAKGVQMPHLPDKSPTPNHIQAQVIDGQTGISEDAQTIRSVSPELSLSRGPAVPSSAVDEGPRARSDRLLPVAPVESQSILEASSSEVVATRSNELNTSAEISAAAQVPMDQRPAVQARKPQHATISSSIASKTPQSSLVKSPPALSSLFDRFKAAYSDYTGDARHFLALCKKIEHLWKLDRMVHKSMWDDYIIRNKVEYAQYLQQCLEAGNDIMPYERFYLDEIEEPKYSKKIVTPQRLEEIISGDGPRPVLSRNTSTGFSTPVRTSFSSTTPVCVSRPEIVHGSASKPDVIDLTDDGLTPGSVASKRAEFQPNASAKSTPPRHVPWLETEHQPYSWKPKAKFEGSRSVRQWPPPSSQKPSGTATQKEGIASAAMRPEAPSASSGKNSMTPFRSESFLETTNPKRMPPPVAPIVHMANVTGETQVPRKHAQDAAKGKGKEAASVTTKAPVDATDASGGNQAQDHDREEWWQDADAPFKSFVRSYMAIRPGHGNSFAKPEDIARGLKEQKSKVRELRHLDVLGWQL